MRLTLRTLLAYLDDILDPAQTKEIGARISENSVASSLVARIREVTRRRRIASPELSGPGSSPDPNVVAEYLDNTLEPAAVADVERVCLDSDVHLAEVAACHQILTIVLGEPVSIRPELRERMYAMGSVSPAPPTSSPANPAPYAVGSARPIASRPVVPDYLKRPPFWKKLVPLTALALVVAGWIYLVYGFLGDDNRNIAATPVAGKPSAEPAVKPAAEKPKEPPASQPRQSDPLLAATDTTSVFEPDVPVSAEPANTTETPTTENSATVETPSAAPPA
ncbi:MAG TPA: hypothetical protein VM452_07725, partial [Caulifigura sp.]|nr:hypothetical protein [Caulifigura sp.]